jgi:hypothetical protein
MMRQCLEMSMTPVFFKIPLTPYPLEYTINSTLDVVATITWSIHWDLTEICRKANRA